MWFKNNDFRKLISWVDFFVDSYNFISMLSGKSKLISGISSRLFSSVKLDNGRPPVMAPFNPEDHGLSKDFILTNFTKMKGWGCKVPQSKLLSYLSKLPKPVGIETPDVSTIKVPPYTLVTTLDFFYPLVESPYMFGRIAFCNTVSDLYAMGITKIQEVLMILGVSTQMTDAEKDVSTTLMIQGFTDAAQQAQTQVGGGQTVYNMWPMMGGCAVSVVNEDEYVMPNHAQPGDKIILTKPLGTRLAINAMQWIKTSP